jgi:hypothetical protein
MRIDVSDLTSVLSFCAAAAMPNWRHVRRKACFLSQPSHSKLLIINELRNSMFENQEVFCFAKEPSIQESQ